ncbi:MAG: fumarylacetoacetate hydrolase family protein [Rhodococcus sp.]|nr:fumarylacetoacetate hydrolase family protein [Rhodococcus sp. (in: high G+C Gram-positive bacteria)]
MRIANIDNRAALVIGTPGAERAVDLAKASHGKFGPEVPALYPVWSALLAWVSSQEASALADESFAIDRALLGAPSPAPRQVFAVGLNYHAHAAESGFESPTHLPPVFTKYASSFTGPDTEVVIPAGGNVDWEVELVAVIGREASSVDESQAWSHVAGLTVGQDISERITQTRGPAAQFGLGKSYRGFSPQGPWLVTPDEFDDPDDIGLGCAIDGETVQDGCTGELIFPVPRLIATLSRNVTLYPGDVIFTGTPAGVGVGREPQRFLAAGEVLHSWIEGIGNLNQRFVTDPHTT